MALPDGSLVLICPVGPESSQVGDADFDAWSADPYLHVEEISADLFALWFSNIKKVSTLFDITSSDPGTILSPPFASTGIQWRIDPDTFLPVAPNNGDHPYPRMVFDGGYIETPGVAPDYFNYVNEDYLDDPDAAYYAGLPLFFIHKDKFYFRSDLPYPYAQESEMTHTVTLTDGSFSSVTEEILLSEEIITRSYTITIEETFY